MNTIRTIVKSSVIGKGIRKGVKFIRTKDYFGLVVEIPLAEVEVVDRLVGSSQRRFQQAGVAVGISREWQRIDAQKIIEYGGGDSWYNDIPEGMEVKLVSGGNPFCSATWALRKHQPTLGEKLTCLFYDEGVKNEVEDGDGDGKWWAMTELLRRAHFSTEEKIEAIRQADEATDGAFSKLYTLEKS